MVSSSDLNPNKIKNMKTKNTVKLGLRSLALGLAVVAGTSIVAASGWGWGLAGLGTGLAIGGGLGSNYGYGGGYYGSYYPSYGYGSYYSPYYSNYGYGNWNGYYSPSYGYSWY